MPARQHRRPRARCRPSSHASRAIRRRNAAAIDRGAAQRRLQRLDLVVKPVQISSIRHRPSPSIVSGKAAPARPAAPAPAARRRAFAPSISISSAGRQRARTRRAQPQPAQPGPHQRRASQARSSRPRGSVKARASSCAGHPRRLHRPALDLGGQQIRRRPLPAAATQPRHDQRQHIAGRKPARSRTARPARPAIPPAKRRLQLGQARPASASAHARSPSMISATSPVQGLAMIRAP